MILGGLWRDLAGRLDRARNLVMRTVLRPFASVNEFEAKVSSQNGEDGIIAELFRRIGTKNRFFVEFGASDGAECNTAALAAAGWSGALVEGDDDRFTRLAHRYAGHPCIATAQARVTVENINSLFESLGVPREFDLLSIDVDGNDYWLWKALTNYSPRVVVIEYNAAYPPPRRWVKAYDPEHRWDKTTYYGASLASLEALGTKLGYALIGTDVHGVNAFFVRGDLLRLCGFPRLDARRAYHPARYCGLHGQLGHVIREGPALEI